MKKQENKTLGVLSMIVGTFFIILGIPLLIFIVGIGLIIFGCLLFSIGIKLYKGEEIFKKNKRR